MQVQRGVSGPWFDSKHVHKNFKMKLSAWLQKRLQRGTCWGIPGVVSDEGINKFILRKIYNGVITTMDIEERKVQEAIGTLKIFEIIGARTFDNHLIPTYTPERWIKAASPADALIFALINDPALANYTITVVERSLQDADNWEEISGRDMYGVL